MPIAYCLMTNHIHLIIDPGDDVASIGYVMKRLAARQTRYVNRLERRSGSLWDGRYKVSPIETESYLLGCCRYVELNPVKAGVVVAPEQYRWSSYSARVKNDWRWLDCDPCFSALATTSAGCVAAYKRFVGADKDDCMETIIRQAIQRNQLTGSSRFVDEVEKRAGIRVEFRAMGRPRRAKK